MQTERRSALKKLSLSLLSIIGVGAAAKAAAIGVAPKPSASAPQKEVSGIVYDQEVPVFSNTTKLGNLLFLSGKGAHFAGDIKSHTEAVLKDLEAELVKAGSSMEKVLKVSVFLNDIADFDGMNSIYKGRFGSKPPVRTTVAVAKGGVPGNALVEMDCIAYI
ncbi:MAG TPA: RidA family protein [Puia sp.]|jgi:enamine deaminase RidA (YjgF/YER057c/UK114 family)